MYLFSSWPSLYPLLFMTSASLPTQLSSIPHLSLIGAEASGPLPQPGDVISGWAVPFSRTILMDSQHRIVAQPHELCIHPPHSFLQPHPPIRYLGQKHLPHLGLKLMPRSTPILAAHFWTSPSPSLCCPPGCFRWLCILLWQKVEEGSG